MCRDVHEFDDYGYDHYYDHDNVDSYGHEYADGCLCFVSVSEIMLRVLCAASLR